MKRFRYRKPRAATVSSLGNCGECGGRVVLVGGTLSGGLRAACLASNALIGPGGDHAVTSGRVSGV